MAGPEIPARHQTLNYILTTLLTPDIEQPKLASAIEFEPLLLLQHLTGGELQQWPGRIDERVCLERVLTLANALATDGLPTHALATNSLSNHKSGRAWQRSQLAGILAEQLAIAAKLSGVETQRCRLLAILLDIGHKHLPGDAFELPRAGQVERESVQYGVNGAELGASILVSHGFSARDCDVLRYQYEELDVLNGASQDLLLIALAGRLADAMLTDFELAARYFELIHQRLGIDGQQLRGILEQAYSAFRLANDQLLGLGHYEAKLSRGNLVQQIRLCQGLSSLERIAQQIFGFKAVIFAEPDRNNSDELLIDIDGEQFSVSAKSGNSVFTQAFQSNQVFSAEENALVAIVDKQMFSRLATGALWLLPLQGTGVAICLPEQVPLERDELLLAVFADACRTQLEHRLPEEALIEVDRVQKRVRELTHEVNNPLAIVQNYLKTLSLKLGPESAAQPDLETISREMLRIGSIIQKYAEIGADVAEVLHPVDLNDLLQSLVGVFRGSHPNMVFQCDVDPNMPPVMGLTDPLKQVVMNLVKNAVEALELVDTPHIWLATNARINLGGQHYVEMIVQDNGPGIPADVYQHLFSTNNSSKGGDHCGLGLSVANRLITEMGGLISCKTSVAAGTQFQVLLPIEPLIEPRQERQSV